MRPLLLTLSWLLFQPQCPVFHYAWFLCIFANHILLTHTYTHTRRHAHTQKRRWVGAKVSGSVSVSKWRARWPSERVWARTKTDWKRPKWNGKAKQSKGRSKSKSKGKAMATTTKPNCQTGWHRRVVFVVVVGCLFCTIALSPRNLTLSRSQVLSASFLRSTFLLGVPVLLCVVLCSVTGVLVF